MAKGATIIVKFQSTASPYFTSSKKNKKNHPEKLVLKKYDPVVRKHVEFKETKI